MADWLMLSLVAMVLWGIVGLLQKVTTNRISADAVLIWDRLGYVVILPLLAVNTHIGNLGPKDVFIGTLDGITNSLGALFLYMSLESGAKASIAVPLTALYPLLTVLLAVVLLGERVKPLHWVGIIVAIAAGILMSFETPASANERATDSAGH
jgi:bacterial/archaeal transporter family protein